MKLRALKVHGFKSFADSTTIEFHDGITAIVGPNGCGKSNIGDAIRWVLGEQRPTAIRGAKMEEAIFQGTVSRRPVNRGSVSLTVSNEDGSLPVPFEEVEIGRQVFRDGGSEYSINRTPCRLRDVVDLCRDTGLGANAYSIIEGRMIDAILSDRADERRALFEEAAGIGKYKDRRKAASRRLERAELDLQRLEDVIAEVQTKVRSLARQKGRAQRYLEFRKRRLDVEVEVVRHQLETLSARLAEVERELETDVREGEGKVAELRAAEAQYEELRLREVEAEKARIEAARALEEIREELVRWERELAVADERAAYAERRLAQIAEERAAAQQQDEAFAAEERALVAERARITGELEAVQAVAQARAEEVARLRDRLEAARARLAEIEQKERELARRGAQLEGDAEAAEAQAAELDRRIAKIHEDLSSAADTLSELESQGDLFSGRLAELAADVEAARSAVEAVLGEVEAAREARAEAWRNEREAGERLAGIEARLEALRRLEREGEGLEPALKALLAAGVEGVLGTLADFIQGGSAAQAVEAFLGPLAQAVVVRDGEAADAVVAWFSEAWEGGGGVIVLPADAAPEVPADASGTLLGQVTLSGPGAPWARALLADAELLRGEEPVVIRTRGVLRVGHPSGSSGVLERRERLRALEVERDEAERAHTDAVAAREACEARLAEVERRLEEARAAVRAAEDARRSLEAEMAAQSDHQGRVDRLKDELSRQIEGARAARERALQRAAEAREDRAILLEQEAALQEERVEARGAVDEAQEAWEAARAEEARLAVDVARFEGDLARVSERLEGLAAAREEVARRLAALEAEEARLRDELQQARRVRAEGDEATERLFGARTEAEARVRERDEALETIAAQLAAAEKRVREARTAERAASDRKHALELERQELDGRIGRIRERLEGEWGKPLEVLLEEAEPVEGDPEVLQQELRELIDALDRIGPVNLLAVEEHEEESQRLEFLLQQRDDLVKARDDLRAAIREINKTATELFMTTFEEIRKNFRETFLRLFEGGEADLWLQESDDPLEATIEIHASPRGKKTQRIDLLSGGERALTALSLLFGIYLVKPSPFCVLDEVDAPLDENNIGRFIKLLQDFKGQTQFVVITHNPRTIEAADWIYGVTMEEPGVSTIVGVKLEEALAAAGAA